MWSTYRKWYQEEDLGKPSRHKPHSLRAPLSHLSVHAHSSLPGQGPWASFTV